MSTRRIRGDGVEVVAFLGWMYDRNGGTERGGFFFASFRLSALTCVLLMLARSISSSTLPFAWWLPFSPSLLLSSEEENVGSKTSRRLNFSAKPSCQPALAHQPTTSSLMLSKRSFRLIMSRTQ